MSRSSALKFIFLLGFISLLADLTYEGARSITGPYLATLGATAAVVGTVAGFGEFIGYALRLFSGRLADRLQRYWPLMIIGYVINLFAVPLLALASSWEIAAFLIVLERAGKAVRHPPRDALLSHAASNVGGGWGFGLHHAMDQAGGVLGPLFVSLVFYLKGSYQMAFASLAISAVLALILLFIAKYMYPDPRDLEIIKPKPSNKPLASPFWLYVTASGCLAAGFADFALIAYHFKYRSILSDSWIPLFYSCAMGFSGLSGLVTGRLYDRMGINTMIAIVAATALFAPFVFYGGFVMSFIGVMLWGIGYGAQNTVMKAAIASIVPANKRGTAYGIFNTVYGVSWFIGSAIMGVLYDISIPVLITFSVIAQLSAIPFFIASKEG